MDIIALGPKFVLPTKTVPFSDVICAVENTLDRIPLANLPAPKDTIRSNVARLCVVPPPGPSSAYVKGVPRLPPNFNATLKKLVDKARDEKLAFCPADKGAGTIIMSRELYDEKLRLHFQKDIFEKSSNAAYSRLQVRLKKIMEPYWHKDKMFGIIPTPDRAPIPAPYGMGKVHKEGLPLRIITPMYSSLSYRISKYLDQTLKPSVEDIPHRIDCIPRFVDKLRHFEFRPSYFMASVDIVALFDNVTNKDVIKILPDRLAATERRWRGLIPDFEEVPIKVIVDLFEALLDGSYLRIGKKILKQKDGVPMGSPISVSVSDVFLASFESEFLEQCPIEIKPISYDRYVDDIFLVFDDSYFPPDTPHQAILDQFVDYLHQFLRSKSKLRFTSELEKNRILAFLDITIIRRNEGPCDVQVYRKPTNVERFVSPFSFVPVQHMRSTLNSMKIRALRYCTNLDLLKEEFTHLHNIFNNLHGYKRELVDRYFNLDKMVSQCPNLPIQPSVSRVTFPFFGPAALRLKAYLLSLGFKVAFRSGTTLQKALYKATTVLSENEDRSNVVYLLTCVDDSCGSFYIGRTSRPFQKRFNEHINAVKSKTPDDFTAAISVHARKTGHPFEFTKFLDQDIAWYNVNRKEIIHIQANSENPLCLNASGKVKPTGVSKTWAPLFKELEI